MEPVKKMRAMVILLSLASVAACAAGLYITVKGIVELVHLVSSGQAVRAAVAPVVTEIAEGLVLGVHYFFVSKFFFHSLRHGVPFTHEGAREVHILGLESILLPILAWIVSAIAYSGIKEPLAVMGISVYEIILGFVLILVSFVMDYGTEKIERGHIGHEEIKYIEKHYPEVMEEARTAIAALNLPGSRSHPHAAAEAGADPLANVTDASDYVDPESGEYIQNIV